MDTWVPIVYRGFWDVPRMVFARHQGHAFLFDCPFDDELDDYTDFYTVSLMPAGTEAGSLPHDWRVLPSQALRRLGTVPVAAARFDQFARPQRMQASVFDLIPLSATPTSGVAGHVIAPTGTTEPAA